MHKKELNFTKQKFFDLPKLKEFVDILSVTQKLKFVSGWVETLQEKAKNTGYQHFSFSHNVIQSFL